MGQQKQVRVSTVGLAMVLVACTVFAFNGGALGPLADRVLGPGATEAQASVLTIVPAGGAAVDFAGDASIWRTEPAATSAASAATTSGGSAADDTSPTVPTDVPTGVPTDMPTALPIVVPPAASAEAAREPATRVLNAHALAPDTPAEDPSTDPADVAQVESIPAESTPAAPIAPDAGQAAPAAGVPEPTPIPEPSTPAPVPALPAATATAVPAATATAVPAATPIPPAPATPPTVSPEPTPTPVPPAPVAATPRPAPPTPIPPAPQSWQEETGRAALALVNYDWASLGFAISFHAERSSVRGLTFPYEHRIEIYVRSTDTPEGLAHVVGHEIGHAVDLVHNSADDRRRWLEARGRSVNDPWWPGPGGVSDFASGAGDFAECFATLTVGSRSVSQMAGSCSAADLALMAELAGW